MQESIWIFPDFLFCFHTQLCVGHTGIQLKRISEELKPTRGSHDICFPKVEHLPTFADKVMLISSLIGDENQRDSTVAGTTILEHFTFTLYITFYTYLLHLITYYYSLLITTGLVSVIITFFNSFICTYLYFVLLLLCGSMWPSLIILLLCT